MVNTLQVQRKWDDLQHLARKGVEREGIFLIRIHDAMREAARRFQFKGKIYARAQAGINRQHDGDGQ